MYTITFYSFKGGVGRSLALSNVAVQLAQTGRSVVILDFDLEAPGLDTFGLLPKRKCKRGLVEYVGEYIRNGRPPDVTEYVYDVEGIASVESRLRVIPAGRRDASYAARLATIDWGNLYAQRDGYLLFEDFRAQIASKLSPDYLLIDSRTGYTDESGICTRQLPDAVVAMFMPDEQNLSGLVPVVEAIRAEDQPPRRKFIKIHFVASNVPNLDDERRILRRRLKACRASLGLEDRPLVVNHYDSLDLLDQVIFTAKRPDTKLARQYRRLAAELTLWNYSDRRAVLAELEGRSEYMESGRPFWRRSHGVWPPDYLGSVEDRFRSDPEVLFQLGVHRLHQARFRDAKRLFTLAEESGNSDAALYASSARASVALGRRDEGVELAIKALGRSPAKLGDVTSCIEVLRPAGVLESLDLAAMPAVISLSCDDKAELADELLVSRREMLSFVNVFAPCLDMAGELGDDDEWVISACLAFIGAGKYEDARKLMVERCGPESEWEIHNVFNYAMAAWGATGKPSPRLFERILTMGGGHPGANQSQCMALSHLVVGNKPAAASALEHARNEIARQRSSEFSCWRYLDVSESEFVRDLDDMVLALESRVIRPRVFTDVKNLFG